MKHFLVLLLGATASLLGSACHTDAGPGVNSKLPNNHVGASRLAQKEVKVNVTGSLPAGSTCDAAAVSTPDADVGAKVNECDRRLGTNSGIIKLSGGGEIKTQIIVSSNHRLYVEGGGEYRASTSGP